MKEAIRFIEALGADSELRRSVSPQIEDIMALAKVAAPIRNAITSQDFHRLRLLLGANNPISCLVLPSKQDDDDGEEEQEDEKDPAPKEN